MKASLVAIVSVLTTHSRRRLAQKCLTHLERDLEALKPSRFEGNRLFAQAVGKILTTARSWHRDYHAGKLSREEITQKRPVIEAQLLAVLHNPPEKGWPADAQRLANRIQRHWAEWFTFLDHPEVKPDNNDAERALRPVVVHRKVTGGARSDWGARVRSSNARAFWKQFGCKVGKRSRNFISYCVWLVAVLRVYSLTELNFRAFDYKYFHALSLFW